MNMLTFWPDKRCQAGFTLIEVLISLVVAVIGIVAVLQLQGVFLQTASDSQKRAMATAIAEKKIEELRGYDSIVTTPNSISSYESIADGTGTETITTGSASYDFDLAWTVTPYIISGGVVTAVSAANSGFKNVTLTVSWDDGDGSVEMSSLVAAVNPQVSKFVDITGLGGDRPQVDHTPGTVPDVVPIGIGNGEKRETSKPLPDVEQSDESTEVRFTTITYDDTDYKQVDAEEFVTVNCFCILDKTVTDGVTPYHHVFEGENESLGVSAGNIVSGADGVYTGAPDANFSQSRFCTRCCAEHHDSTSYDYAANGVPRYDNTVTSGAHKHYKFSPEPPDPYDDSSDPPSLTSAGNGDTYLEACRFRRVDGIFRIFPDWELLDLNVMPYNYLASTASSSLSTYQQYVRDKVHDEVFVPLGVSAVATPLTGRDFDTFEAAKTQVLSRGIYYDDLSYDADWLAFMTDTASSGTVSGDDWLKSVPFYEINTTLLTTWEAASTAVAEVTSEDIDTVVDESIDYYGVYSRGRVTGGTAASGASTVITAYSKTDNTGVLGNTYANPSSYISYDNRIKPSPGEMTASLAVSIVDSGSLVVLSGVITEAKTGVNLNKVTVNISSGSCPADEYVVTGNSAAYNCYVTENAGSVIISPATTSNNDFLNPTAAVGNPAEVTAVTAGTANGSNGTITLNAGTDGVTGLNFNLTK